MATCYICKRCNRLKTNHFSDFKKHLNRKIVCKKNSEVIFLSNDQLLVLSLIPYHNDKQCIDDSEIEHLKHSDLLDKNKKELFSELDKIEKNGCKKCSFCNQEFNIINDYKKHFMLKCYHTHLLEKEKNNESNNNINGVLNNNCNIHTINNNTTNTTNNNTTNNNNINIYLDVKSPIPFDNDWDISKIDNMRQTGIIVSKYMYTQLLEEILKNKINLNVLIDKEKESGMVYKNDNDKYIQMKSTDIVSNTMEKLNKQLNTINDKNNNAFKEILTFSRQMINKKFIDFENNDKIQEDVNKLVCNIYNERKKEAYDIAADYMKNLPDSIGY